MCCNLAIGFISVSRQRISKPTRTFWDLWSVLREAQAQHMSRIHATPTLGSKQKFVERTNKKKFLVREHDSLWMRMATAARSSRRTLLSSWGTRAGHSE